MKQAKDKVTIKQIVDEIYESDMTPNNKREWFKAMDAFFAELKEVMNSPEAGNISLVNFASIKVKPLAAMHELNNQSNMQTTNGAVDEAMLEGLAKKVVKILEEYEYKLSRQRNYRALPKSVGTIAQLCGAMDERHSSSAWWQDYSAAIRATLGRIEDANRSKAAALNGHGAGADGE